VLQRQGRKLWTARAKIQVISKNCSGVAEEFATWLAQHFHLELGSRLDPVLVDFDRMRRSAVLVGEGADDMRAGLISRLGRSRIASLLSCLEFPQCSLATHELLQRNDKL
jgi:hypothetical protein